MSKNKFGSSMQMHQQQIKIDEMIGAHSTGLKTPMNNGGLGGINLLNQSMGADNESAWGVGESFLASGVVQPHQGLDGVSLHKPMYQLSQDGDEGDDLHNSPFKKMLDEQEDQKTKTPAS